MRDAADTRGPPTPPLTGTVEVATEGDHQLYVTWYVKGEVEDVSKLGRKVSSVLPGRAVELLVSVRDVRSRGCEDLPFKVMLLATLEEAEVPVRPWSLDDETGYDVEDEYGALVDYFGGVECLDVKFDSFQMVQSTMYEAVCDKVYEVNMEALETEMKSPRLGPVKWSSQGWSR